MKNHKRDFDLAALTWDEKPQRVKLAKDIFTSLSGSVSLTEGMDVLDFGCGTGLLSLQILDRTGNVTCADSSAGMLEVLGSKARSAGLSGVKSLHLKSDNGEGLSGSYDLITSSMTFHHVQDVKALVNRLAGLLKPGGTLFIADLDPDEGKFHEDNTGVFHKGFSRELMAEYFTGAGLSDIRSGTAAVVDRKNISGETVTFSVFMVMGRR